MSTTNTSKSPRTTTMAALITTTITVLVAVLAISLRTFHPELLLRIPRVGFVLYYLIGGVPIPPFFESTMFHRDEEWLRPNDVVVSAGAKTGTTWLLETVHQIRMRGRDTNASDVFLDAPWAEYKRFPGETKEQRMSYIRSVSERFPFGVYKTHYAPPVNMPRVRNDVKYVLSFRDPFDSVSSFVTFGENYSPSYRDWWGGFPPVGSDDLDSLEKMVLRDKGDGKSGFFEDLILDHVRGFWPYRNSANVLWLHYADRLSDPVADLDKISSFLGIQLSGEEKRAVLNHTSFATMKARDRRYRFCGIFDEPRRYGLIPRDVECMFSNFVVKGAARRGKDELRSGAREEMVRLCHKHLGVEVCEWLKSGGTLPDVKLPAREG
jgi:hypothetical protein